MEKISLPKATALTSPNPLTLVCTEKPDGSTNLATVSWWTPLSFNPPMAMFAMAKTSYSGERTRETRRAIITIPGEELAQAAVKCGTSSGRDTDKAQTFGIELMTLEGSKISVPVHSRVAVVCRLKEHHEAGDHYMYVCEVEEVFADDAERALFAWDGYAKIAPAAES